MRTDLCNITIPPRAKPIQPITRFAFTHLNALPLNNANQHALNTKNSHIRFKRVFRLFKTL